LGAIAGFRHAALEQITLVAHNVIPTPLDVQADIELTLRFFGKS